MSVKTKMPQVVKKILKSKRAQWIFNQLLWIKGEVKTQLYLAIPIALSCVLLEVPFYTSIAFVGHIEGDNVTTSDFVDAIALNISFIHLIITSITIGMATAVETLVSQSVGAGNFPRVGVLLQRAILIFFLVMLLQYTILFNSTSILHLLHQPPCVIDLIEEFTQVFYAAVPPFILQYLLTRYYQVQGIVLPFILTGVVANVVNIVAHFVFVVVLQMEMRGAALSLCVCYYSQLLSIVVVGMVLKLNKKTWNGWSRECLNGWGEFLKLGLPGVIMVCLSWSSTQAGFLLLGFKPGNENQLGVLGVITNYEVIAFIPGPLALGMAMAIQIGTNLGAGKPKEAKKSMFTSFVMFGIWVLIFEEMLAFSLREYLPRITTSDECILRLVHLPWLIEIGKSCFGFTQYFLSCVLRGCGLQLLGGIVTTIGFGFLGFVVGAILVVILDMGAAGLLIGLTVGAIVALICYIVVILFLNWDKRSKIAQDLAKIQFEDDHRMKDNHDGPQEEEEDRTTSDSSKVKGDDHRKCQNSSQSGDDKTGSPRNDKETTGNKTSINKCLEKKGKSSKLTKLSFGDLTIKFVAAAVIVSITIVAICIGNEFVYKRELCILYYLNSTNATVNTNQKYCT